MAAMTACGPVVQTSEEAELLACRRALEFAVDAGFHRLIIEGDNCNVTHAISSSADNNSLFGNVMDDIRHLIRGLHWSAICCIRRSGNRVAHALAQHRSEEHTSELFPYTTLFRSHPVEILIYCKSSMLSQDMCYPIPTPPNTTNSRPMQ